jgi:hypothetical protein
MCELNLLILASQSPDMGNPLTNLVHKPTDPLLAVLILFGFAGLAFLLISQARARSKQEEEREALDAKFSHKRKVPPSEEPPSGTGSPPTSHSSL